ncbi:electron transport complex protein RnfE [Clostridium collagenovorans DSM 3089]|uniref:Ion-translocating oxidoreductase complex subunit E n=1 Tax=Clostridium collagenovorans DSM 3089 TaxID=1121306 RepID=A0A1M5TJJ5_9CLOT|nr:electron transport complex subunit E [Clostridium collagenovorans]SHH50937.1 electron transport complex protein RnfE [Clostridium collagenovorans DSM 3089]
MSNLGERLKVGIILENPVFVQVLAMCPVLGVTSSVNNAIGMGLATTAVLIGSNAVISLLRKVIPDKIRIPAYIVVIASFVTLIKFLLQGYLPELYKSLGLFIPLIVVNCIILGRAEAYASKNNVINSIFDAIGMGLGFTFALSVLASFRELLGAGTILGFQIMPSFYEPAIIMTMAPGGFITLGLILAGINQYKISKSKKANK